MSVYSFTSTDSDIEYDVTQAMRSAALTLASQLEQLANDLRGSLREANRVGQTSWELERQIIGEALTKAAVSVDYLVPMDRDARDAEYGDGFPFVDAAHIYAARHIAEC
jgi:hypothetical protein